MIIWYALQNSKLNEIIHYLPALAATIAKEMIKKVLMLSPLIFKWWALTGVLDLMYILVIDVKVWIIIYQIKCTNSYYLYLHILKEVIGGMAVNLNTQGLEGIIQSINFGQIESKNGWLNSSCNRNFGQKQTKK